MHRNTHTYPVRVATSLVYKTFPYKCTPYGNITTNQSLQFYVMSLTQIGRLYPSVRITYVRLIHNVLCVLFFKIKYYVLTWHFMFCKSRKVHSTGKVWCCNDYNFIPHCIFFFRGLHTSRHTCPYIFSGKDIISRLIMQAINTFPVKFIHVRYTKPKL